MPLVRSGVRNEFGLGDPELYRKASRNEEPKAILDGVAVAGLVGILRQLGDLAEFAADVFHDLHEQITATSVRGRKLMTRVRNIESALPSVEKAFKEQTSHIHFAYIAVLTTRYIQFLCTWYAIVSCAGIGMDPYTGTSQAYCTWNGPLYRHIPSLLDRSRMKIMGGFEWHARVRDEQSLLSCELPQFIMDSYEECRDPPHLFLLDKFDQSGTGACLKRYSDPSYFRRVWAASQMEQAENVRKEKKVQKIKRKGSRLRNAEIQNADYIPQLNSRKSDYRERLASPSIDGHSISPEHMSTPELRLNPEFSSRSTSFGLKTRESYLERTSSVNPPMVSNELDYIEVLNPNLNSKDRSLGVSGLHDDPSSDDLDNLSQHDSIQEKSAPGSSFITWDEKAEIVRSASPGSFDDIPIDRVQVAEDVQHSAPQQAHSEPDNGENSKVESLIQGGILFHSVKIPGPLSGVNHFDEVISETDNYVDAPNILDSETETEAVCRTKREVPSLSNLSSQRMESKTGIGQIKDIQTPDSPDTEAPNSSQNSLNATRNVFRFNSSDGSEHVQSPYATEFVQNQECSHANDYSENKCPDVSEMTGQYECSEIGLSPKSETNSAPKMTLAETKAEPAILEHSNTTDVASAPAIQLWTNGELFGFEPSKPPDLGAANKQSGESSTSVFSNHTGKSQVLELDAKSDATINVISKEKVDSSNTKLSSLVNGNSVAGQNTKSYPSCCDNHHDDNVKPFSQRDFGDVSSNKTDMTKIRIVTGTPLGVCSTTESRIDGPSQSTVGASSSFSELAQRFLANTIQRKTSFSTTLGNSSTETRKQEENSCLNNNKEASHGVAFQSSHEQSANEKVAHVAEKVPASLSSHYSEQSSPPLEYMKISYHPMNGLENSKLKLEFSSGLHENNEDFIFPSSQLLQDPGDTFPEVFSESDDDTFCRSCPYSSEDLLSLHSYSNSEQWEKEERSEYFDHEYDVSHRLSSTTSVSRCMGFEQNNPFDMHMPSGIDNFDPIVGKSKEPFQLVSTMELPGLDSVLSLRNQQDSCSSLPDIQVNAEAESKDETSAGPPLPPLPPMQWRASKSSVTLEDTDANIASNLNHLNGLQSVRCPSQKAGQYSPIYPSTLGEISLHTDEKVITLPDQSKSNGQIIQTHSVSNKEMDTREDILLQIRKKAFNLRRITTSIPRDIPRPTTDATNGNVAAILQKASALRQAFVSSDDDNWSDA